MARKTTAQEAEEVVVENNDQETVSATADEMIKEVISYTDPREMFKELSTIDLTGHIEEKKTGRKDKDGNDETLSYLNWAYAFAETFRRRKDVSYEVKLNENGLPYFADPLIGAFVYTSITIDGIKRDMFLPVLDSKNRSMYLEPHVIKTRYGEEIVPPIDSFAVNRSIMRCLVKNLAMFGTGISLYAGESEMFESEEVKIARVNAENDAKQMQELIRNIDMRVKEITKDMSTEDKKAFATNKIVPIIGVPNYRTCKEKDKLEMLYENIKAA